MLNLAQLGLTNWLSGSGAAPFNILTDVPGLRFLYDGDSAVLSGANIESVTNQVTGQANLIKLADGSRPTSVAADLNGHKTIDFSGAQALKINVTDISTVDMTWFVVFKTDGTSGANRRPLLNCWSGSSSGFSANIVNNTAEFFIRSTTSQAFTDTAGWHVMMVKAKHYGTGMSLRVMKVDNGTPVNSVTSAISNLAFNMFVGTDNSQALFYDGKMAEIIGVSDVVTEATEANIYTYLNTKYGLSVTTTMPEYTFESGALTYTSTLDGVTGLNYNFAISGKTFGKVAPILVLGHGHLDDVGSWTSEIKKRMANLGFYLVIPSMRGRSGGGGLRDSGGIENYDLFDAAQISLTNHPDLTNSEMINFDGDSGGGANAIGIASKLPEMCGVIVDNFGMTDYMQNYNTTSWYAHLTVDGAVAAQLELDITQLVRKTACVVVTTGNITLSGTQTINGVAVVVGNRVEVNNQTNATENGIYVCAAGAWSRSTDMDVSAEFTNAILRVTSGTVNAGTQWLQTTSAPTVGVSNIVFAAVNYPSDYENFTASRNHRFGAVNNYEGRGFIIHDEADTAVEIDQSDELWKQVIDQSRTANWEIHVSGVSAGTRLSAPYTYPVTSGNRYNHGYPDSANPGLIASEAFWVPTALTATRPASKTSGTYRVNGFVKNRKFRLLLGMTSADGKSGEANLVFNYNTNSYTLTPTFYNGATSMVYAFLDDIGRVSSGTITGATPFTPV